MTSGAARAADGFRARFGRPPEGVWRAPGRVNLIGEHTDYNDGFVLPFAIDRSTWVAARVRDDRLLVCTSAMFGDAEPLAVDDLAPRRATGWASYVHGVVAELLHGARAPAGLEVFVASDLPAGGGLSSSAALECATALAVRDLFGVAATALDLALAAQRAEQRFAGVPCGVMDQIASVMGRAGHALVIDTRSLATDAIGLDLPGRELLVIDTLVRHALADGEYAKRRASCEQAARALGVPALRDATLAALPPLAGLSDELFRRARHVVTENARVLDAVRALREHDEDLLARAMRASHASLRDDFEVSSPELDRSVDAAVAAGAVAARMTGGGFGGCAIAIVPRDATDAVTRAVVAAFERAGDRRPEVTAVRPANGASREA